MKRSSAVLYSGLCAGLPAVLFAVNVGAASAQSTESSTGSGNASSTSNQSDEQNTDVQNDGTCFAVDRGRTSATNDSSSSGAGDSATASSGNSSSGSSASSVPAYVLYRPDGFEGGNGTRVHVTFDYRKTVKSNRLGKSIRRSQFSAGSHEKRMSNREIAFVISESELRQALGARSGASGICAVWDKRDGDTKSVSDRVCFRLGGSRRGLTGEKAGTIGVCQPGTGTGDSGSTNESGSGNGA